MGEEILKDKMLENNVNKVRLSGKVIKEFTYSHQVWREKFYKTVVRVKRDLENFDDIPVIVSEGYINENKFFKGKFVELGGEYKSFSKVGDDAGNYQQNAVFVSYIYFFDTEDRIEDLTQNQVFLEGRVFKKNDSKIDAEGRRVLELVISIERYAYYHKYEYIPCVIYGIEACNFDTNLEIGNKIEIYGRIQTSQKSREETSFFEIVIKNFKKIQT